MSDTGKMIESMPFLSDLSAGKELAAYNGEGSHPFIAIRVSLLVNERAYVFGLGHVPEQHLCCASMV